MDSEIKGLNETIATLQQCPAQIVILGFQTALDRAGGVIAAEIMAQAPEGEHGELKEAAAVDVVIDSKLRGGVAFVGYPDEPSARTEKPLSKIAQWVEEGHIMLTHSGKPTKLDHTAANPFMRRGLTSATNQAVDVFAEAISQVILENYGG